KVHVDDIPNYLLSGQETHVVRIDPAYNHVDNYTEGLLRQREGMTLKWPPPSRKEWAWSTQRLIYARGVLENAFEMVESGRAENLKDALEKSLKSKDHLRFFELGNKVLSPYNLDHDVRATRRECPTIAQRLHLMILKRLQARTD